MTQNQQTATVERSPQQVAADLFRIGENPNLPAWQYPVLQQAIDLLVSQGRKLVSSARVQVKGTCRNTAIAALVRSGELSRDDTLARELDEQRAPATVWLWDTIQLARRAIRRSDADLADALEARLQNRFASQSAATITADQRAAVEFALGACAGHVAGERHVAALESLLSSSQVAR